mmetsp:Transcript_97835/g.285518  ORF Transcript_97835/g.285518 Transcript_97835/m.285518 type:complete len:332 (+) Transcript_97835:67-1062(+)
MTRSFMLLPACFVLLHLGTSLRLPPSPDETAAIDVFSSDDAESAVGTQMGLPNISEFQRVWTQRYHSEHRLNEPTPNGVKLVLGVFSQPYQTEYRKVLQRTWLRQKGVCLWRPGPPDETCRVHVAFVFGNSGNGDRVPLGADTSEATAVQARTAAGSFVVDVPENMNRGKTFAWFQAASKAFPWATHIGKCDMDTYPFLHKLLARMSSRRCVKNDHEFAGQYTGLFNNSCAPRACETNYDAPEQRMQFISRPSEPFVHVGGQFYLMSRRLAQKVARPGSFWEAHRNWPEGHAISRAIDATATEHKFCVFPWLPDSWYHHGEEVGSDFANDF